MVTNSVDGNKFKFFIFHKVENVNKKPGCWILRKLREEKEIEKGKDLPFQKLGFKNIGTISLFPM